MDQRKIFCLLSQNLLNTCGDYGMLLFYKGDFVRGAPSGHRA
jgi:hypothetical protein